MPSKRIRALLLQGCFLLLATGCSENERASSPAAQVPWPVDTSQRVEAAVEVVLFEEGTEHWRSLDEIDSNAGVEWGSDHTCRILAGEPISAVRYEGPWELPVIDYEITFDARRVEGQDFFAALTFPVHSLETCLTFIPGGWGGSVTGISSINGIDASANETTSTFNYTTGEWYTFRIQVLPDVLKVWNGGAIIARVPLAGRRFGLRRGDIEYCAPLGFATYMTTGEIRNLKIKSLTGEPLWRKKMP